MDQSVTGKIDAFNFKEFLYDMKVEMGISYIELAQRANIPRAVMYKYSSGDKPYPSLTDFISIMHVANMSLDEWYFSLLGNPNQVRSLKSFMDQLSNQELELLDKIKNVDESIRDQLVESLIKFVDVAVMKR